MLGRPLQTQVLAERVRQAKHGLVYAGYLVAKPGSPDYYALMGKADGSGGPLIDIDSSVSDRWCLYIGYKPRGKAGDAAYPKPMAFRRLSHGGITDTELQIGEFALRPGVTNSSADHEQDRLSLCRREGVHGCPFSYHLVKRYIAH